MGTGDARMSVEIITDEHYNKKKEIEEKNKLPSDEQFCCRTGGGGWRCKNLRMGHGAAADIVRKTNRCEKHYYDYVNYHKNLKEKKRSGDGEETRASKRRKKKVPVEGDETEIQKPRATCYNDTSDIQIGSVNIGTKRKNVERTEESGELDFTVFLTENPPLITSNKMKKKKKEIENKLPPDEQRCCVKGGGLAGGGRWRCKNFRMGYGVSAADDSVPRTRYCEKHYIRRENIKKRFRDGEVAGRGHIEETRGADGTESENVGATSHVTSVTIVDGGTGNIWRKMKIVERMEGSGEPESSTKTREPLVEFESMETYKSKCFELSAELEKKKVECTQLQVELADVVETKKTNATDGAEQSPTDAAERWRKMFSDLESQVWGMENRNSAMAECVESRALLVLRSGKDSSILRCGEIERDETPGGGRAYCHVYELKTKEEVLNMYENLEGRKGWGFSEERPSQHGSSSKDHLEMSREASLFVHLVSDDDSGESPADRV